MRAGLSDERRADIRAIPVSIIIFFILSHVVSLILFVPCEYYVSNSHNTHNSLIVILFNSHNNLIKRLIFNSNSIHKYSYLIIIIFIVFYGPHFMKEKL